MASRRPKMVCISSGWQGLENPRGMARCVKDHGARDLDVAQGISHPYPATRSASVNGRGKTVPQHSQNPRIIPGPRLSQRCRKPVGSSVVANPLSSSV